MRKKLAPIVVTCLTLLAPSLAAEDWTLSITGGALSPNGEFHVVRQSGKVVRTGIDPAASLTLTLARRLGRRIGIAAGLVQPSDQDIWLRQDLPDGTVDIQTDRLSATTLIVCVPIEFLIDSERWRFTIAPAVSHTRFGDVNLGSAGPPYDLERPLDLDVDADTGAGVILALDRRIGHSRWAVRTEASLFAIRLQGNIRNDVDDPEPDADVDLPYNPLTLSIGISRSF